MRKNKLKAKLKAGEAALGPFVGIPSPAIVETMGWLGFDFVVIDCEHGPMDYETVEHMVRAAEVSDTTPVVRIGLNEQQHIQRYLEAGAAGVMMPLINSAADGRRAVDSVKYPPVGRRGAFAGRSAMFGIQDVAEYIKEANEETFVCLQIETKEAIQNADEIIAVEGADCIFLGPGDLSVNFGYPGQWDHPEVVRTVEEITKKILDAGKIPGTLTNTAEVARYWRDRGSLWLVNSALRMLMGAGRTYLEEARS